MSRGLVTSGGTGGLDRQLRAAAELDQSPSPGSPAKRLTASPLILLGVVGQITQTAPSEMPGITTISSTSLSVTAMRLSCPVSRRLAAMMPSQWWSNVKSMNVSSPCLAVPASGARNVRMR